LILASVSALAGISKGSNPYPNVSDAKGKRFEPFCIWTLHKGELTMETFGRVANRRKKHKK